MDESKEDYDLCDQCGRTEYPMSAAGEMWHGTMQCVVIAICDECVRQGRIERDKRSNRTTK